VGSVTDDVHSRPVAVVDAFTDTPLAGSAAGVVPDAGDLSGNQMGAVARELAVDVTAFLGESEAADWQVRYYTPAAELDRDASAAVAAASYLRDAGELTDEASFETNAGPVTVAAGDDAAWVHRPAPSVERVEADLAALGVDRTVDLPVAVADAGAPFLIVPLDYLSTLRRLDPGDAAVEEVCESVDAGGVYAFTFDTLSPGATVHGRVFPAQAGVPEASVGGAASAAVAAYLREAGAFDDAFPEEVVCEGGHVLDRPGTARVRLDPVRVGGKATTALEGTVRVPEPDEDGILEA
jgi:PhzF family phenazine biosynthesis protein